MQTDKQTDKQTDRQTESEWVKQALMVQLQVLLNIIISCWDCWLAALTAGIANDGLGWKKEKELEKKREREREMLQPFSVSWRLFQVERSSTLAYIKCSALSLSLCSSPATGLAPSFDFWLLVAAAAAAQIIFAHFDQFSRVQPSIWTTAAAAADDDDDDDHIQQKTVFCVLPLFLTCLLLKDVVNCCWANFCKWCKWLSGNGWLECWFTATTPFTIVCQRQQINNQMV